MKTTTIIFDGDVLRLLSPVDGIDNQNHGHCDNCNYHGNKLARLEATLVRNNDRVSE